VSGLLFFLTKRKSGWGRVVLVVCLVWFLVCFDLPALMDLLGPCTNVVLTAYAHVRTEPQCDIGHTREKKNLQEAGDAKLRFYHSFVPVLMALAAESLPESGSRYTC